MTRKTSHRQATGSTRHPKAHKPPKIAKVRYGYPTRRKY